MSELVVAGIIMVLVVPSFVLLYILSQRGILAEDESGAGLSAYRPAGEPGYSDACTAHSRSRRRSAGLGCPGSRELINRFRSPHPLMS